MCLTAEGIKCVFGVSRDRTEVPIPTFALHAESVMSNGVENGRETDSELGGREEISTIGQFHRKKYLGDQRRRLWPTAIGRILTGQGWSGSRVAAWMCVIPCARLSTSTFSPPCSTA